ncbi:nucleoside diphosphate kinase [Nephila pilipes]|uniref:nucleoside-diphosphate kinase n=1 Tax=Nephila pilipes TaxID=299642 RepID=A0A8X6QNG3_NEPPI|nr:nucleoside diphosphate kinase [Nephila pilipes]
MVVVLLLFLSALSWILSAEVFYTCSDNLICVMPQTERTFIMIKPDGVQRNLVGKVISRFEEKGFKLVAMKFINASKDVLEDHYSEHTDRPFFESLVSYMQLGPVVPMVWEGLNVVKTTRDMIGATNPLDSLPGTLRGDFCIQVGRNLVHGSDTLSSAKREISLWFEDDEMIDYALNVKQWVYESK